MKDKLAVLTKIANKFNEKKICWSLGGSMMLFLHNKIDYAKDIDIFVAERDVEKAQAILSGLGTKNDPDYDEEFNSKYFSQYTIDGVDVDLIAGFTIIKQGHSHYFPFEKQDICEKVEVDDTVVYLQCRRLWKNYYSLMGRKDKAMLCE